MYFYSASVKVNFGLEFVLVLLKIRYSTFSPSVECRPSPIALQIMSENRQYFILCICNQTLIIVPC